MSAVFILVLLVSHFFKCSKTPFIFEHIGRPDSSDNQMVRIIEIHLILINHSY